MTYAPYALHRVNNEYFITLGNTYYAYGITIWDAYKHVMHGHTLSYLPKNAELLVNFRSYAQLQDSYPEVFI